MRRQTGREIGVTPNQRWRHANPEKAKAQSAVATAIRNGRMVRQPCDECGASPTHAHHNDYSQPLSVVWLCARCHRLRHVVNRVPKIVQAKRWVSWNVKYYELGPIACGHLNSGRS